MEQASIPPFGKHIETEFETKWNLATIALQPLQRDRQSGSHMETTTREKTEE
jgi:hypothetical protein